VRFVLAGKKLIVYGLKEKLPCRTDAEGFTEFRYIGSIQQAGIPR
jgi:hypothetical protein